MKNYSDSSSIENNIAQYRKELKERYGDRFDILDYYLDESINDSILDFKGKLSNLDQGFEKVYNQFFGRNIGGVCLISDGNYNSGINPLYTAEKISLTPVFTLGIGDTILKKDQLIRNVLTNSVAFLGNKFPVEVEIQADRMQGARSRLMIIQNGQTIASKDIVYGQETKAHTKLDFLLEAQQVGFNQYQIVLEHIDGEVTYSNNDQRFFIEVIDSRSKVLILAESPHPDVSAVKQALDKDDKLTITSKLYSEWDGDLKDVELLVAHGFHKERSKEVIHQIKRKGIPVFYLADNSTTNNDLKDLGVSLNVPSGTKLDEVQGYVEPSFQLFELSPELVSLLEKSPPVHVRFGNTKTTSGDVLIGQRLGPVKKVDPLYFFGGNLNEKYAVFTGEGLWRWKLYEYQRTKENKGFIDLIRKTVQYLIVKSNKEPLRVILPNRFNEIKDILINAEFYNASMESITEPDISLEIKDEKGRTYNYQFSKNDVDYTLNVGKLESGKYTWKASTTYNKRNYSKQGEFIVENIALESKTMNANFSLLFQISDKTNGSFHRLKDYNSLLEEIGERGDIVNVVYEESSFKDLIDIIWILIIIIVALSAEWFLRRWKGSY